MTETMKILGDFLREFGLQTVIILALLYLLVRVITSNNKKTDAATSAVEAENKKVVIAVEKDDTLNKVLMQSFDKLLEFSNLAISQARQIGEQEKTIAGQGEKIFDMNIRLEAIAIQLADSRKTQLSLSDELAIVTQTVSTHRDERARISTENESLRGQVSALTDKNSQLEAEIEVLRQQVDAQQTEIDSIRRGTPLSAPLKDADTTPPTVVEIALMGEIKSSDAAKG